MNMKLKLACTALLWIISAGLSASTLDQAASLLQRGQAERALSMSERQLEQAPDAAGWLFLKARSLAALGRGKQAEAGYRRLIEQHPHHLEAYNNLAALLVQQGRLDEASQVLEQGLTGSDPTYATAYRNLKSVNIAIARASYGKALRVEVSPQPLTLTALDLPAETRLAQAPPAAVAGPVRESKPEPEPEPEAEAETKTKTRPESRPETVTAVLPTPDAEPVPGAGAPTRVAVAVVSPEISPSIDIDADPALLEQTVRAWAQAWSDQDVAGYLAFYASDFQPDNGLSRRAWERQRQNRVSRPDWIRVGLEQLSVTEQAARRAVVEFTQSYQSDGYADVTRKQLVLKREAGAWRIARENSL